MYITHPRGALLSSLFDNQEGTNIERYIFGSSRRDVSNVNFLAPVLFQLSRYRAWKTGPGRCGIRRRIGQFGLFFQCLILIFKLPKGWGSRYLQGVRCTKPRSRLFLFNFSLSKRSGRKLPAERSAVPCIACLYSPTPFGQPFGCLGHLCFRLFFPYAMSPDSDIACSVGLCGEINTRFRHSRMCVL